MEACSVDYSHHSSFRRTTWLTEKIQGKKYWHQWLLLPVIDDDVRGGKLANSELRNIEAAMWRSDGHCAVYGDSFFPWPAWLEALGISLPENAAIPAADCPKKSRGTTQCFKIRRKWWRKTLVIRYFNHKSTIEKLPLRSMRHWWALPILYPSFGAIAGRIGRALKAGRFS